MIKLSKMLEPIINKPVLSILDRKAIVVADLHLGIEYEMMKNGIYIPSQTDVLLNKIMAIIDEFNPRDIIFLGDIKHNIPLLSRQERKEIPDFFLKISNYSDVYITKGNHDGNLEYLIPRRENIFLYNSGGFVYHGIGLFHGHAYPSDDVFECKTGVMAHIHPVVRFTDNLSVSNSLAVWLRVPINKNRFNATILKKNVKSIRSVINMDELVVIPAFSDLCGGLAVNVMKGSSFGFLESMLSIKKTRAYLLDGTDLGYII